MDTAEAVALVAAALDDSHRCQIGDPRRGTYHVSFPTDSIDEAERIRKALAGLGVAAQVNARPDSHGKGRGYVAIYKDVEIKRLYEALGESIREERRNKLDELIRARGPIPDELLQRMIATIDDGKSPEQLAQRLNEQGLIDGMGGIRWTAKKVGKALAHVEPYRK